MKFRPFVFRCGFCRVEFTGRAIGLAALSLGLALGWRMVYSSLHIPSADWAPADSFESPECAASGEFILRGLSPPLKDFPGCMPLESVASALIFNHSGLSHSLVGGSLRIVTLLLAFAVSCILMPLGALASLAIVPPALRYFSEAPPTSFHDQILSLQFLMAGGLMIWRHRSPSLIGTAILSLLLGSMNLYTPSLAFFPLLLASFEFLQKPPQSISNQWKHGAVLCLGPYLFIAPWISADVHWTLAPSLPGLSSLAERISSGFIAHPWLFVFSLLSLWIYRRRKEYQDIGLLLLFICVDPSGSLTGRHFTVAWPLLLLLSTSLLSLPRTYGLPRAFPLSAYLSQAFLSAASGMVISVGAFTTLQADARQEVATTTSARPNGIPPNTWLNTADQAIKTGRPDLALTALNFALHSTQEPEKLQEIFRRYARLKSFAKTSALPVNRGAPLSYLDLATTALEAGHRDAAKLALDRARNADLDLKELRRVIDLSKELKSFRSVLALLKEEGNRFPTTAWLDLAEAALSAGDKNAAHIAVARAQDLKLEFEDFQRLAITYAKLGKFDESSHCLALSRRAMPAGESLLAMAVMAFKRGHPQLALENLERAEKLQEMKPYQPALRLFKELVSKEPSNPTDLYLIDRGVRYNLNGEAADVIKTLRNLSHQSMKAEEQPTHPKPNPRELRGLAQMSMRRNDFVKAYSLLLKIPVPKAIDWIDLAQAAAKAGKHDTALRALDRALLNPGPEELKLVAKIYIQLKRWKMALWLLAQGTPGTASFYIDLADAAAAAGNPDLAREFLERAEKLPLDIENKHRLAITYQEIKQYPRALRLLVELTTDDSTKPIFFNDLGVCYYLSGDAKAAEISFRRAIILDPHLAPARKSLDALLKTSKSASR